MRNKPTPSSLNLTKTTCENFYRKGDLDWFRVFVGEEQWFTNGHVMMNQAPPFKDAEKFIGPLNREVKTAGIIDNLKSGQRFTAEPGPVFTGGDDTPLVPLVGEDGKRLATLREHYASLMCWTYKECTFHVLDSMSAVEVRDTDHNLVALAMPARP